MSATYYITAGLPAIDSEDSPPSGDNIYFITAGLPANDYVAAGGLSIPVALQNVRGGFNPIGTRGGFIN